MKDRDLCSILAAFMEEVWNEGDFSNLARYVAAAYTLRSDPGDPWDGQTIGHDTFMERVAYSRNAFPDLHFDLQEMVAGDDTVAVRWMMLGTHAGDLPRLPATGNRFSIPGMTFYYFVGDKLCGHAQAFDRLGFLSQTGNLGRVLGPH